jgi:hypothetical protein
MIQNNNQSMQTVVETFLVEETIELIHDADKLEKWNRFVDSLGLKGQTSIVKTDKSPVPFLWMNETLVNAFDTLCPKKVKIEEYNLQPIPLEILELVSLSKQENYFDLVQIWYNDDKDPVCVGLIFSDSGSDWSREYNAKKYLIGRWADVKASLDTLIERARKLFIHTRTNELKTAIKSAQRQLDDIELDAARKFAGLPQTDLLF